MTQLNTFFLCIVIFHCDRQNFARNYPLPCGGCPRGHILGGVLQSLEWCFLLVDVSWRSVGFCDILCYCFLLRYSKNFEGFPPSRMLVPKGSYVGGDFPVIREAFYLVFIAWRSEGFCVLLFSIVLVKNVRGFPPFQVVGVYGAVFSREFCNHWGGVFVGIMVHRCQVFLVFLIF